MSARLPFEDKHISNYMFVGGQPGFIYTNEDGAHAYLRDSSGSWNKSDPAELFNHGQFISKEDFLAWIELEKVPTQFAAAPSKPPSIGDVKFTKEQWDEARKRHTEKQRLPIPVLFPVKD